MPCVFTFPAPTRGGKEDVFSLRESVIQRVVDIIVGILFLVNFNRVITFPGLPFRTGLFRRFKEHPQNSPYGRGIPNYKSQILNKFSILIFKFKKMDYISFAHSCQFVSHSCLFVYFNNEIIGQCNFYFRIAAFPFPALFFFLPNPTFSLIKLFLLYHSKARGVNFCCLLLL